MSSEISYLGGWCSHRFTHKLQIQHQVSTILPLIFPQVGRLLAKEQETRKEQKTKQVYLELLTLHEDTALRWTCLTYEGPGYSDNRSMCIGL